EVDTSQAEEVVEDGETEIIDEEGHHNPLQEELNETREENERLQDKLLRTQTEFENYKRRTEKEKVAERKYKSQDLATGLLPVLDNFERALQTEVPEENKGFFDGIKMVYDQLQQAIASEEITSMDVIDQEFDPNLHHAVMQVEEADKPSNTIVEELQKGYMIKDRVIRPAMVKVNK